jgi:hypothetical protein
MRADYYLVVFRDRCQHVIHLTLECWVKKQFRFLKQQEKRSHLSLLLCTSFGFSSRAPLLGKGLQKGKV